MSLNPASGRDVPAAMLLGPAPMMQILGPTIDGETITGDGANQLARAGQACDAFGGAAYLRDAEFLLRSQTVEGIPGAGAERHSRAASGRRVGAANGRRR